MCDLTNIAFGNRPAKSQMFQKSPIAIFVTIQRALYDHLSQLLEWKPPRFGIVKLEVCIVVDISTISKTRCERFNLD
jgi:hypothetical protein